MSARTNTPLRFAVPATIIVATAFVGWTMHAADEPTEKPAAPAKPELTAAEKLFVDQVGPILRIKCTQCHGGADLQEGGLDLTTRAAALVGGMSDRKTLVPGKPEESLLYVVAVRSDPDLKMPPDDDERLSEVEIKAIKDWIAGGAPWPELPKAAATPNGATAWDLSSPDGVVVPTSGGLSPEWTNRKYAPSDVWAYLPVKRYAVPRSLDAEGKQRHPIDAFLNEKLAAKDLPTAPRADPATWLRRATFDLTGLPPDVAEVQEFARSIRREGDKEIRGGGEKERQAAYAAAIDRLLDSPHYGEQMARHWLDVVRYGDTSGFSNDYERPHAWRYRDYVVRSFNSDKSYDRFIIEQLAGDELDAGDPELLIAVGFLRMGPWEHTAMSVAAETRQAFLDDVTNSVGVTFLGQGLRCARCHDHKFDPVPTRDYYRLQACFAPVQFLDRPVPWLPNEDASALESTRPRSERLLKETQDFLAATRKKRDDAVAAWAKDNGFATAADIPADKRPPRHLGLTDLEMSLEKIYQKREAYYQVEVRRYEAQALSVYDGPNVVFDMQRGKPQAIKGQGAKPQATGQAKPAVAQSVFILAGGSIASPGERVTPGVLSACFGSSDMQMPTAWNTVPQNMNGRRLALARWVASDQNPLTARVIVNRVWQMHFGRGLVATPNSFGKMGSRPTHPELLDWLAVWFMEHDWSIKKLHRLIMTSDAYCRAGEPADAAKVAELDSKNELLSYFPPRRLAAEELRDAMLAHSGELNRKVGGPPVFPEINWETAMQPRHIMGSVAPAYQPSPQPADRHRRTLYAFHCRTLPDPMLEVFNKPGSDTSCERRDQTMVTPQVFALLNGQATHDRALALAARLTRETASDEARLERLFEIVLGRTPTAAERRDCLAHVAAMKAYHAAHSPAPTALPATVRREMVEELTGETFAWDEELDQMKVFVPDLKPWQTDAGTRAWAEVCLVLFNSNEFAYVR